MNVWSGIIIAVVVVAAVFAARHMMAVFFGKKSCCDSGSTTSRSAGRRQARNASRVQNIVVADTDESHYPYREEIIVGGMTCEHCQHTVEGAINALPDTWATVDLGTRTATVRGKKPVDLDAVEKAVSDVGYYIIHQPRMSA